MSSAALEVQTAIFAILDADATLSALVTGVFDDVPESYTDFPYVTLGEDVLTEYDTDALFGFRVSVTIHCWSQYKGQRETKLVQDAIYLALHHASLTVSGYNVILSRQVDQTSERDPDGMTRHGVQTFELLVRGFSIFSPTHSDLLAFYTMDNISGSTLVDENSGTRNATIVGTTTTTGLLGDAMQMGSPNFIDVSDQHGDAKLITATQDFEIVMWTFGNTSTGTVFAQYSAAAVNGTRFQCLVNGATLTIQAGASGGVSSLSAFLGTGWNMVTFFKTGGDTFGVSVNNVVDNTGPGGPILEWGALIGARTTSQATDPSTYNTLLENHFPGKIDQFRVFGRALTVAERTDLYNSGAGA
jgi:hypothetical protein